MFKRWILLFVFLGVFCFSGYMIVSGVRNSINERDTANDLSMQLTNPAGQEKKAAESEEEVVSISTETNEIEEPKPEEPVILPAYEALYAENHDLFGWIRIGDTILDNPVMHTPSDPEYYLHRDFSGNDSSRGELFLKWSCFEGCGNYIIYGHHMKNGTMFTTVTKYEDKAFWWEHPAISFDTLYEAGNYEVLGAFYSKVYSDEETEGFRYYDYTDLRDPAVFEEYVREVKAASLYDTGLEAEYGDELITLSTCEYHTADGRFVVVARKVG